MGYDTPELVVALALFGPYLFGGCILILQYFAIRYNITMRRKGKGLWWRDEQIRAVTKDPEFYRNQRTRRIFFFTRVLFTILYIVFILPHLYLRYPRFNADTTFFEIKLLLIFVAPHALGTIIAYLSKWQKK